MMDNFVKTIDASPSKRIYLSIIADYDIKTALCELIDNAIDNWIYNSQKNHLTVSISLDYQRQTIFVEDNSGGIKEQDIHLIVSPGQSKNSDETNATIGIFGVGSKRAVVALAEEIRIYSRYPKEKGAVVSINDDWIKDDTNWELPLFASSERIQEGTTNIELLKLRNKLQLEQEKDLIDHFGATYSIFIKKGNFNLFVNDNSVEEINFNKWSYPPDFEPKSFNGKITFQTGELIHLQITGGLTKSGEPAGGEYGAYIYCNDRLITRAFKGPEVGYKPLRIGNPHPSVSLARVIVKISGNAQLMPWNSSKSEVNTKHPTFGEVQEHIERILTHYATLSKRWSNAGGWEETVFKYKTGDVKSQTIEDISSQVRLYLPPIPRPRKRNFTDIIKANNKSIAKNKPWVVGLYESIIAVDDILKLKLDQKNRIALLIIDSTLEIAFKEYLVNDSGTVYSAERLERIMKNRSDVHREVKLTTRISSSQWTKIDYYYKQRCELVHKRASATVTDHDLRVFRDTAEYVLKKLFGLNFKSE